MLLEGHGFVAAIAHDERRAVVGQFKEGAVASSVFGAQSHPFVNVGIDQRGDVKQAAEQHGAGECTRVKAVGRFPAASKHHAAKMPAGRTARNDQFLTIAAVVLNIVLHPSHRPTRLIHDPIQADSRCQRVVDCNDGHSCGS